MNDEVLTRIEQLEARLQLLDDRAQIAQLISSYGPAVDSGDGERVKTLWLSDGTYELEGYFFTGEQMATTVQSDLHVGYMAAGSAHVLSMPKIEVVGDEAVAINYSTVFIFEGGRWVVDRVAANRWDLRRTAAGWRVQRRVNRLLKGTEQSRALLSGEVPPQS